MWKFASIIIVLVLLKITHNEGARNVALFQPELGNSGLGSYSAVDGRYRENCISLGGTKNWWCVDLQHTYRITNITIHAISYRYSYRLNGFELSLGTKDGCSQSGFETSNYCYKDKTSQEKLSYTIDQCNLDQHLTLSARSVYISRNDYLQLCEVDIFSDSCPFGLYGFCKNGQCNSTNGECISCVPGRHGNLCQEVCEGCRTCRQSDGFCDGDCIDGFWGNGCVKRCPSKCLNSLCNTTTGYCSGCEPGRYGNVCENPCPTCEISCMQSNGSCVPACDESKWGFSCENNCSDRCKNRLCNPATGHCMGCIRGRYGNNCEEVCPACNVSCEQSNGVCIGACHEGFWGRSCEKPCPSTCNSGGCSKSDGQCFTGCKEGWYKKNCNSTCSEYCIGGCRQMDGICHACTTGRFGLLCERRCLNCRPGRCSRSQGICFTGCMDGVWGDNCTTLCGNTCKNGCLQSTGFCLACVVGAYGKDCKKLCPNCDVDGCRQTEGICNTGCRSGWFGERCDQECGNGCRGKCHRFDGVCKECMDGQYGSHCQQKCNIGCMNNRCDKKDGSCRCSPGFTGKKCETLSE